MIAPNPDGTRSRESESAFRDDLRRHREGLPVVVDAPPVEMQRVVVSMWGLLACVGMTLVASVSAWHGYAGTPALFVVAVGLGAMSVVKERA